jgi:hypothetical protein
LGPGRAAASLIGAVAAFPVSQHHEGRDMPPAKPKTIEPDRLYRISFSRTFEDGRGRKYIPRAGVTVQVKGRVLETIKDHLDHYEVV